MSFVSSVWLALISTVVVTAHAEPYSETVRRETGLRPGHYRLAPGSPNDCLSGELQIIDVAPEAVSIMLETTELIDAIGPGSDSPEAKEGQLCEDIKRPYVPGSIRAGHLDGSKIMKCPQVKAKWVYSIDLTPNGFTYELTRGDKTERCTLIKRVSR